MELGSRAGTLLGGGKCSGRAGEEGSNGELHLVVLEGRQSVRMKRDRLVEKLLCRLT